MLVFPNTFTCRVCITIWGVEGHSTKQKIYIVHWTKHCHLLQTPTVRFSVSFLWFLREAIKTMKRSESFCKARQILFDWKFFNCLKLFLLWYIYILFFFKDNARSNLLSHQEIMKWFLKVDILNYCLVFFPNNLWRTMYKKKKK